MRRLFASFIIAGILLSLQPVNAQMVMVRDFQFWPSVGISKSIGDHWSVSIEEQLRLEQDATQMDEFLTHLGVNYSPWKGIRIGLGARGIRHLTNSGDYENRVRLNLDVRFRYEIDRLDLTYRARYQTRWDEDEVLWLNRFRNRVQVDYNIAKCKFDPFAYVELFLNTPGREILGYNGFRLAAGVNWKISKSHRIKPFYMFEREVGDYYPVTFHRLGLNYELRL